MNEQEEQTVQILTRGVSELVDPNQSFQKKIQQKISGTYQKDIVVKYGVDITRPDIHLGHAVELRKLRALQDIGCKVVFLVGDFTTQIGDPTGKSKVRPEISQQEIENNLKTYLDQVGKILKVERDAHGNILHTNLFINNKNSKFTKHQKTYYQYLTNYTTTSTLIFHNTNQSTN
jgi:tyrosyl-tRNA synthetase